MPADRVLFVDGGRVLEDGTIDELLAAGGRFGDFWNQQRAAADWHVAGLTAGLRRLPRSVDIGFIRRLHRSPDRRSSGFATCWYGRRNTPADNRKSTRTEGLKK
jgi:hypothetical protein